MKNIFFIIFLLFQSIPILANSLSSGFGRGTGVASTASKNFVYGDRNPANFAYVPEYLGGVYLLPIKQPYTFENSVSLQNYGNAFIAGPIPKLKGTGFYGEIITGIQSDRTFTITGMGGGLAYEVVKNLSIGVYGRYEYGNAKNYLSASIGLLYSFKFDYKIIWDIGFFDFSYGLSYATFNSPVINNKYIYNIGALYPAFSFAFIKNKYIRAYYDATIPIKANFSDMIVSNGFRFNIVNYIDLMVGFTGDDFFKVVTPYVGFGCNIPLWLANIHLNIAYSRFSPTTINNDISVGGYLQLPFSKIFISRTHTDKRLLAIFDPEFYITPNGDQANDFLTINLRHPDIKIVRDWSLVVLDEHQNIVIVLQANILKRLKNDLYELPNQIIWNALDYKSILVPDAEYCFKFLAITVDNVKKYWNIGCIKVDSNPPIFLASITNNFFHINGRDMLRVSLNSTSNDIELYTIKFINNEGAVVSNNTIDNPKNIKSFFYEWNGNGVLNKPVSEGMYSIVIEAKDFAGNLSKQEIHRVFCSSNEIILEAKTLENIFSPNKDGKKDEIGILLKVLKKDLNFTFWTVDIFSYEDKKLVKSFGNKDNFLPSTLFWDGYDNNKKLSPSGQYFIVFNVYDENGSKYSSSPYQIILDNNPPIIIISVPDIDLTPDADNHFDFLKIKIHSTDLSYITAYKLKIIDDNNNAIKIISGKTNLPTVIKWDGVDSRGVRVDNLEDLRISLSAVDAAGNIGESNEVKITTGIALESTSNKLKKEREIVIRFSNIKYDLGSERPTLESQKKYLNKLYAYFVTVSKKYPDIKIKILGHTDTTGTDEINTPLSLKRAEYILEYLLSQGANKSLFIIEGKGSKQILYPETDEFFQAKNRRIEFVLTIQE